MSMEDYGKPVAENELVTLREGIKTHYQTYHERDSLRFPMFEFNTNRVNYEPLRESFEEEFFVVRRLDRQQKTIHIPSTNTLSLLFTDDRYVPSQKIWNTCLSYTEGEPKAAVVPIETESFPPKPVSTPNFKWLQLGGLGLLAGLFFGIGGSQYYSSLTSKQLELTVQNSTASNKLKIDIPTPKSRVPATFLVNGQANPGETVWIVMHFQDTDMYWVQFPALVDHRGYWLAGIGIGKGEFTKVGKKHELRAFVNPVNELRVSDVLRTWPKAERSTEVVELVMDPTIIL